MNKKRVTFLVSAFALCGVINVKPGLVSARNNSTDTQFSYNYCQDGSDGCAPARKKMDNSASYIKIRYDNPKGLIYWVAADTSSNANCLSMPARSYRNIEIPLGGYAFFSNDFYPKYRWAFPCWGGHDGSTRRVAGKWSPDNYQKIR